MKKLDLFKKASQQIPAYSSFLKSNNLDAKTVRTTEDLELIPITDKENYLRPNSTASLIWPDSIKAPTWYCSTSGSTGEPYYFPRNDTLALQASYMVEEFLDNSTYGNNRTLVLIGFGMGVWIGGVFTVRQFEIAAERTQAPVSILPVGYNKTEMFKALKKLSPNFDQTVICGYPPFIKDLIDECPEEGIDLKSMNIRLLFAAESYTEMFRDYVCEQAGIDDPVKDTMNIYGTADLGAMAYETPLSILIRRVALNDPMLFKDLFGQISKTPTLAEYNNEFIDFEKHNESLLITADAALPLIRYDIGDNGGVLSYEKVEKIFKQYDMDIHELAKQSKVTVSKRPFVFVYERKDMSTSLHGINIYPEYIKDALISVALVPYFTERFTMATKNDIHHNQYLQINLELRKNVAKSEKLKELALGAIRQHLIYKSSEFAEISKSKKSSSLLQLVLWVNGHPRYFAPGTKQKWVEKNISTVQ